MRRPSSPKRTRGNDHEYRNKDQTAWKATKSYFGFGIEDRGPFDEQKAHHAADAGQARTKIKAVFDH